MSQNMITLIKALQDIFDVGVVAAFVWVTVSAWKRISAGHTAASVGSFILRATSLFLLLAVARCICELMLKVSSTSACEPGFLALFILAGLCIQQVVRGRVDPRVVNAKTTGSE